MHVVRLVTKLNIHTAYRLEVRYEHGQLATLINKCMDIVDPCFIG